MKKVLFMSAMSIMCTAIAQATVADGQDSLRMEQLEEVSVSATRAGEKTPMAHTDLGKREIESRNLGKDLPFLLSLTPSVTTTSDAGNGIGYTSIRVRGIDPSRINITANGIPLNDAESAQVYWVNINDFASSAESMQIQRGLGTSTNGAGAFGASVNIKTDNVGATQGASFHASAGSYGTHKETFTYSTGLLQDHWGFQGRLSNIRSDGYLDRAWVKLNSYFLQGGYYGENTVVKFITFNGVEQTYHAWNYTSKYEQSLYGRTYNSCGEYYDAEGNPHYYKDQTDNYRQQHYQLLWNQLFNESLSLNAALHYTKGRGYYEEYKSKRKVAEYGLEPIVGLSETAKKVDLVRQKKMDNDFYGFTAALNYDNGNGLKTTLGGAWNRYDGDHFGYVKWVKNYSANLLPDHKYYDNNAVKDDGNVYAKVNWDINEKLSLFGDVQYRHTSTQMDGPSDDFDDNGKQIVYNEEYTYDFFNPKGGVFFTINDNNKAYASVGMSHKEPTRNDYEDNLGSDLKAEKLIDYEAGYKFGNEWLTLGINYYMMQYSHQFVLTGKLNEIGEMIASNDNSGKSYRTGVELEAAYQPLKNLRWDVNATLSRNRNKSWTVSGTKESWESAGVIDLGNTPTSFSPEVIANSILTYKVQGLALTLSNHYVGEQYLTNTGFKSCTYVDEEGKQQTLSLILDDYFTTDFDLSYTWKNLKTVKAITAGVTLYNLFSTKYDNNGWAYCEVSKDDQGKAYAWTTDAYEAGFAPQAPFHFLAHLSIHF